MSAAADAGAQPEGGGGCAACAGSAALMASLRGTAAAAQPAAVGVAAGAMVSALRRWPSVGSGSRSARLAESTPASIPGSSLTAPRARPAAPGGRSDGAAPPPPLPGAAVGAGAAQMCLRTANPFARPARPPSAP
jgi:hypothetical protein